MENSTISEKRKELLEILTLILSYLKINDKCFPSKSLKITAKNLNLFSVGEEDKELFHFSFFTKQLFLNDNGKFDFNVKTLKDFISLENIKKIFVSLDECINSKTFLEFLFELGEIICEIYYNKITKNFNNLIDEFEYKGINNYELLFNVFSKCKNNKNTKYIFANYDIYYSETYKLEITYNILISNNLFFNLCISSPKFDNLSEFIDDEFLSDNSIDYTINKLETYILKNLRIFYVNSLLLYSCNLNEFMNIFYDYITQKSSKNFIKELNIDDSLKEYYDYISFYFEKLFKDFNEENFEKFKLYLFKFIDNHKNKKIKFVDRAISIKNSNPNLKDEEIGLISFICSNNNFIKYLEKLVDNNKIEDLDKIIDEEGLLDLEILILEEIFKEKDYIQISSESTFNDSNKDESKIKNDSQNKVNNNITEIKTETSEQLIKNENFSNDKLYKEIDFLKKQISSLNQQISQQENKLSQQENKLSHQENEYKNRISNLEKEVEELKDIHKKIYFRDVSKFYIYEFAKMHNINADNTYKLCKIILNLNFTNLKSKNLKNIILKIVTYYINGNKLAHLEYFISKRKLQKKELIKEIESSYMNFMEFNEEEKKILYKTFKFKLVSFLYHT